MALEKNKGLDKPVASSPKVKRDYSDLSPSIIITACGIAFFVLIAIGMAIAGDFTLLGFISGVAFVLFLVVLGLGIVVAVRDKEATVKDSARIIRDMFTRK